MLATTKENQPAVDDIDIQEKSETRKAIENSLMRIRKQWHYCCVTG